MVSYVDRAESFSLFQYLEGKLCYVKEGMAQNFELRLTFRANRFEKPLLCQSSWRFFITDLTALIPGTSVDYVRFLINIVFPKELYRSMLSLASVFPL